MIDGRSCLLGQLALCEQFAQGSAGPHVERRPFAAEDVAALLGDGAQRVHAPLDAGLLHGELLDQSLLVLVPTRWDAEREVGEVQCVEPVGVERAELQAIADAEGIEDRGEQATRLALADVVHADIELEPVVVPVGIAVVAAEDLRVAAGDVVALQHQHPFAR